MKISIDTRTLQPGDIFIPVKGKNFDGHNYIEEAKRKGASEILDVDLGQYAREHRKKLSIPVIAITGSSGKTTTKDLLAAVLATKYKVHKTKENYNNETGVPLTLLGIEPDTQIAIVEMAMRHPGEIKHLASLALPTHCIITNVGYTHLELLKTQSNIARVKAEIFSTFPDSPLKRLAFYPADINKKSIIQKAAEKNDFFINEVCTENPTTANMAMIRAVSAYLNITEKSIIAGLKNYVPSTNRQQTDLIHGITLINDAYNANPDSMAYALALLGRHSGRKIAVLGDMLELGDDAAKFHKGLGKEIIKNQVEAVFTLGKLSQEINPRKTCVYHFEDKQQLVTELNKYLKKGDIVLFKASRGLRLEEAYAGVRDLIL